MLSKERQIEMDAHNKAEKKKRKWDMSTRKWICDTVSRFLYKKALCPNCKYKIQCLIKDEFKSKPFCGALMYYGMAFYMVAITGVMMLFGRSYSIVSTIILYAAALFHIVFSVRQKKFYHKMLVLDEQSAQLGKQINSHTQRHMGSLRIKRVKPPPPPPPPPKNIIGSGGTP